MLQISPILVHLMNFYIHQLILKSIGQLLHFKEIEYFEPIQSYEIKLKCIY